MLRRLLIVSQPLVEMMLVALESVAGEESVLVVYRLLLLPLPVAGEESVVVGHGLEEGEPPMRRCSRTHSEADAALSVALHSSLLLGMGVAAFAVRAAVLSLGAGWSGSRSTLLYSRSTCHGNTSSINERRCNMLYHDVMCIQVCTSRIINLQARTNCIGHERKCTHERPTHTHICIQHKDRSIERSIQPLHQFVCYLRDALRSTEVL
jgi:hypothetical protein